MSAEPRRERTVDEVKDRYYSVARAILTHQGCKILTRPFDAEAEMRRKKDLEQMQMRTKQQQEKSKHTLQDLKKIEVKIKRIEVEEANYARLMDRKEDEAEAPEPDEGKKEGPNPSGVYLLQNRFQTKLPVNESMQYQIKGILSEMKIKPHELHYS